VLQCQNVKWKPSARTISIRMTKIRGLMVVPTSMSVSRRPQVTEQKKDRVSIVPMMEFGLHGTSDQIVIL
jgi:hypothetical protein